MFPVVVDDVLDYLGRGSNEPDTGQVYSHLAAVTAMVKAYTRGQGFADSAIADDLAMVIITSTARLISNPTNNVSATIGDVAFRYGIFDGWTLPELAVLHNYRRRAA